MKVIVNVLDNSRAVFIMELLHSLSYVKVQPVTDENILLLNENEDDTAASLPFQKQIKQKSNSNIAIKPSDYFGTLSEEEGKKFKNYVNNSRLEWERNF